MTAKAIIIDDELRARTTLSQMLNMYCPTIEITGQADSVLSGLTLIKQINPDIVFLDIKMPDGTGFDLLNRLEKINFALIFLTAFDEYAVKAFKFSAVDYLLKPIDPDELSAAVDRAIDTLKNKTNQLAPLIENLKTIRRESKKIVLKTAESIYLVSIADIIRCESTGNYTRFFLTDKKAILVSRTLKDYDELLTEYGFYRVHQSHLVNLSHINRLDKADGGVIIMNDGQQVPISTRKKDALIKAINDL